MKSIRIGDYTTTFSYGNAKEFLKKISEKGRVFLFVDESVYGKYADLFKAYPSFKIPSGERGKSMRSMKMGVDFLLEAKADRKSILIGIGGGVATDLSGFVASIYMRGIRFGFIPTTLLAMVDASLGGKNGINAGVYKNMIGLTAQPYFLHYDYDFLTSLEAKDWRGGFAEIIKHACIQDSRLFNELEKKSIDEYKSSSQALKKLIERNIEIKYTIVEEDPKEKDKRRLLNFGHTIAHGIERTEKISHGRAVAIGMAYASKLSEKITGFTESKRVISLIERYELPTNIKLDFSSMMKAIAKDKKKEDDVINEALLAEIGAAAMVPIPTKEYERRLRRICE